MITKALAALAMTALLVNSAGASEATATPPTAISGVVYAKIGNRELHVDLVMPSGSKSVARPVVVWIHGGGWSKGTHKQNRAAFLAEHGYVVASVEYRLTDEAIFPAQIHDCKAAIRFLRARAKEYGIDPSRIGAWGSSAGGHLVALLGTSDKVKDLEGNLGYSDQSSAIQAVCDFFGPADFTVMPDGMGAAGAVARLLGGPPSEKRDTARLASPITHVTKDAPPFLIVHGEKDALVPISQSERLQKALKTAGSDVTLMRIENAGHGFAATGMGPHMERINQAVLEFFDKHLKPAK